MSRFIYISLIYIYIFTEMRYKIIKRFWTVHTYGIEQINDAGMIPLVSRN